MKHILILAFGLTLPFVVFAQLAGTRTITTAVPFLTVNNDPVGSGMGEIGVVAAPQYYEGASQMNPALLARGEKIVGGGFTYSPWLRGAGVRNIHLMDLNLYGSFDRISVGINARRFDFGEIILRDSWGEIVSIRHPIDNQISGSVALKITDNLSAGLGLQFFNSRLINDPDSPELGRVRSIATNFGFYYENKLALGERTRLRNSWGLAVLDLGPKVSYTQSTAESSFIPINLVFGIMEGIEHQTSAGYLLGVDLGMQVQKLMVPSEGGRSDLPLLSGMFGSFSDAPLAEEFRSLIWQFGTEARLTGRDQRLIAIRGGMFLEDLEFGNRKFFTIGSSVGIHGISANVSMIHTFLRPTENPITGFKSGRHLLDQTFRFNLGYTFLLD